MYRTICTIHRYDTIHTIYTYVSNDSQALTIRLYDTKLFVHNIIRIVWYVSRIVQYWQLYWQDDRKLVARLQSRGGIGRFLFQPSWGFLPSSIRPYRLWKSHSWNLSQKFIPYLTNEANPTQPYVIILISDFTLYAFATK